MPLNITADCSNLTPPVASKKTKQTIYHNEIVTDDYYWLREKDNPEVIAYLEAENAYTQALTHKLQDLSDTVYKEIKGRLKETDMSVPSRLGKYYYYQRTETDKQYPIYCRRLAGENFSYDAQAKEEVLLDKNQLAQHHDFFDIHTFSVSPNDRYLAYTIDITGYRQYRLCLKDLQTGQLLTDTLDRITSLAWALDNQTLFLVQEDATTKRANCLLRLTLGTPAVEVYYEAIEQFSLDVTTSRDRQFILLHCTSIDTSETKILSASHVQGPFHSILGRRTGHRYQVDHRHGELFILTNQDAKNFRLVVTSLDNPEQNNWRELLAHSPDVLLSNFELFQDFLVVSQRWQAKTQSRIYCFTDQSWQTIAFEEEIYTSYGGGTPEFTAAQYRLIYESPLTPKTVLDVDRISGQLKILKQKEVPNYCPDRYQSKRLWVTARDGTQIPLYAVFKKGIKLNGTAPLLLYAYGSYGISLPALFSNSLISLLERGVIYVGAHIRGGCELGEHWHEEGKLMQKKNTFYDFIDSAQHLIKEGWTHPSRLIIEGGSAGGMLMGAVINMRPDLFHAVHAAVPFVDVINTMMDSSLPLTTGEYLEWGDPNHKASYDYIRSYSPYDNIEPKAYPALLVTAALNDSQVMYWEPAKYVAKLRSLKTDANSLLLKMNMHAGHGGASGRYEAIKERAFELAWMLSQWGIQH